MCRPGLYRYRLGDVVKVKAGQSHRKGYPATVEVAAKILADSKLEVDFTSHANTSTDPGNYVIFWELSGEASEFDKILEHYPLKLQRHYGLFLPGAHVVFVQKRTVQHSLRTSSLASLLSSEKMT
nr:jasmonic acid-amido synthetase JAR1-like [Ipomoea batatas]